MSTQLMMSEDPVRRRPPPSLREYQKVCIDTILRKWEEGVTRQLVALPTGTGKTRIAAELGCLINGRVLFIVQRGELVRQTVDAFRNLGVGKSVGVVQAERNEVGADIVVCTVQSASQERRIGSMGEFELIIADESHHAVSDTHVRLIESVKNDDNLLIGLTATPERSDGSGLGSMFEEIVYELTLMECISSGFLCDLKAVRVEMSLNLDNVAKSRGDFTDSSLGEHMMNAEAPLEIAQAIKRYADDRRSVVFCPTVAVAEAVTAEVCELGISAATVVGTTPHDERQRIYRSLESGNVEVLVGCQVFEEGWDVPRVDCCVMARATTSRPAYIQRVGRALRLHPDKNDALLLDLVGVSETTSLITVADLVGIEGVETPMVVDSLVSFHKDEERRLNSEEEIDNRKKRMISRGVDVFDRKRFAWNGIEGGGHCAGVGDKGHVAVLPNTDSGTWSVVKVRSRKPAVQDESGNWRRPKDNISERVEIVDSELTAEQAQLAAEDILRTHKNILSDLRAPWRGQPATAKQLRRLGNSAMPGCTKGQAADMITAKIVAADIRKARKEGALTI